MLCKEVYQSIYIPDLDPYTEKTTLSELMGVHRNTVGKWHKWANLFIADYKKTSNDSPLMSRYQCWVIGEIHRLSILLKRKKMIWEHLKLNNQEYSFVQFQQIYK